jgi:NADP-dependent 3-hydroxy acid dehydrogenase YdfG
MSASLDGQTIVVVGASSGIGRGIAVRSVKAGADVLLAARRADRLAEVVAEAGGGQAVPTDLRKSDDCAALAEIAAGRPSAIDLLLISAGTAPLGKMANLSAEDWKSVLETNLMGIHQTIAALLDHLSPQAIVAVVSSEAVLSPRSHLGAYGASKAALEHTILQWQEEHPGLRFTTISLGPTVPTEFGHGFSPEAIVEAIEAWAAAGRAQMGFMDTEEVCEVLFQTLGTMLISPTVGMPRIELRSPSAVIADAAAAVDSAAATRAE